ncbi:MAG TPA: amino acid ABC transporter permease [Acidimicrobiales bacterium]|nr:amino acid ABC transporter permease [Acidimicrobiales bacterium]
MNQTELTQTAPERPDDIKAVPVRRPGRWLGAFIVLVIAASIIRAVVTNNNFGWSVVGQYLFDHRIISGAIAVLYMTALAMVVGVILGTILAIMRLSPNPVLKMASWLYIWFFRGTPLLVQFVFWFNIKALFPHIDLGVPFGPSFIHADPNSVITVFGAAFLALSTNEGAYMAEVVRAGIISVPEGQSEAAASLGLNRLQIMRKVVLPQAMRVILPPTGNETISMLKNISIASVIGFAELYYQASDIYAQNYETIPLLIVASIWYLALTSIAYVGQYFLERKVGQGFSRSQQATMKERWLSLGGGGGGRR